MTASAGTVLFVADPLKLGETAVKWYTMFPLKPTPVYQRHKLPDASQKLAGALYALERYEECLQATKTFPNFGSHRDENEVLRQAVKAKIQANFPVRN